MTHAGYADTLWPSDTKWWSGSTLVHVMYCYVTAPSHCPSQYWFIIKITVDKVVCKMVAVLFRPQLTHHEDRLVWAANGEVCVVEVGVVLWVVAGHGPWCRVTGHLLKEDSHSIKMASLTSIESHIGEIKKQISQFSPWVWAMGCLLWVFWRTLLVLWQHPIVYQD